MRARLRSEVLREALIQGVGSCPEGCARYCVVAGASSDTQHPRQRRYSMPAAIHVFTVL